MTLDHMILAHDWLQSMGLSREVENQHIANMGSTYDTDITMKNKIKLQT